METVTNFVIEGQLAIVEAVYKSLIGEYQMFGFSNEDAKAMALLDVISMKDVELFSLN